MLFAPASAAGELLVQGAKVGAGRREGATSRSRASREAEALGGPGNLEPGLVRRRRRELGAGTQPGVAAAVAAGVAHAAQEPAQLAEEAGVGV